MINRKSNLKRALAGLLAAMCVISFLGTFVSADTSNANGSNSNVNSADYAFYRKYEYGYRVSVYAGKKSVAYPSDRALLSSRLSGMSLAVNSEDFVLLGTVDLVNSAMGGGIRKNTYIGGRSKICYRENSMGFIPRFSGEPDGEGNYYTFWRWNLPVFKNPDGSEKDIFTYYNAGGNSIYSPDAVALGDSDEELTDVKYVSPEEFFLSRTTLSALLMQISRQDYGNDDWFGNLFAGDYPLSVTSGGVELECGREVWADDLDPLERNNIIPYVIVYEPLALVYLRGSAESVLFTPTEFALSQGTYWNWFTTASNTENGVWPADGVHSFTVAGKRYDYSPLSITTMGRTAQAVQSLVFGSLPSSVYLDESWFGHPKFSDTVSGADGSRLLSADGKWWSVQAVVEYGGWGMEFFAPSAPADGDEIDLGIAPVLPNAPYGKGNQVVTSFNISNASALRDVFPEDGIVAEMTVSDARTGKILARELSGVLALPVRDVTVVWFLWTVPEDAGDILTIRGRIVFPGGGTDITPDNNSCAFNAGADDPEDSRVPSDGYLTERVTDSLPPADFTDTAYWSEWRYEPATGFVRYTYSCRVETDVSSLPDEAGHPTENPITGKYTVKSGYGFETEAFAKTVIEAVRTVRGVRTSFTPPENYAVSPVQSASAHFPEKGYSALLGNYETLEKSGGFNGAVRWRFRENPEAEGDRIHYMPVSYPDGEDNYAPYVLFSQIWTPAGMIEAGASPVPFSVDGSLFDDWYAGR